MKEGQLNQFRKASGIKPNILNLTDLSDDGVIKTSEIKKLDLAEEEGLIKSANKINQTDPVMIIRVDNDDMIYQSDQSVYDQVIKGSEQNRLNQTDIGEDGVIKKLSIVVEDVVIKGDELCQSGPFSGDEVNANKIIQTGTCMIVRVDNADKIHQSDHSIDEQVIKDIEPNKLKQTDLCDQVIKTSEINQLDLAEQDEVIKGIELCQSGTYDGEEDGDTGVIKVILIFSYYDYLSELKYFIFCSQYTQAEI